MKTIITIVLLSAALVYTQTISDSAQTRNKNQEKEKTQNQNSEIKQIQDQTGPKQNAEGEVKQNRKNKDVFIDKDGDGICDTRQSGMSFNKMRKRLGAGKQGPGSKGNSGNQNGNSSGGR
jgi:hypothetical protein